MPSPAPAAGPLPTDVGPPRAAYIHVPFCAHHCGYCNFTVVARRDDLIDVYLDGLARELARLRGPRPVETLFVGGGTPTHLPPAALDRLLRLAREWFPPAADAEITVEANPAGLDPARIEVLARHGVNRVSLGAQSFQAAKLRLLERDHVADDIAEAVARLRPVVRSLSLDLIFGVPGETLDAWQDDLRRALDLRPDHLSTYGLTFERGTTFYGRLQRGELAPAPEETERAMYLAAIETLGAAGFEHVEVSNFARPGHACRHNEVYWRAEEYYAAGPGAARYVGGRRETNHRSTTTWLRHVLNGQSPVAEAEELAAEDRAREALVLGLRRLAGVDRAAFAARWGVTLDALGGPALVDFLKQGLLVDDGPRVRLSREGLLVSDALWPKLLRC